MNTNKKIKLLDFKLTKTLGNSLFGLYKSKFSGNGIDFIEHKEYIFGDPIKNIDWKTLPRTQKLYTKIFEEDRDLKVLFLIDFNKNMDFQIFEKTKKDVLEEVFYSLGLSSYNSGDTLGAYIYGIDDYKYFDYKKGIGNIFGVLNFLNENNDNRRIDSNRTNLLLKFLSNKNIKNNLIFILSDDLDGIEEKLLKVLSIENQIIFINIFDDFENNLTTASSDITLSNGKNFYIVSLSDRKKIEEYKKLRKEKISSFEKSLKKNKIPYLMLDTKKDIFKELYLFFSKLK